MKKTTTWVNNLFANNILQMRSLCEGVFEYGGTQDEYDILVHINSNSQSFPAEVKFGCVSDWNHVLIRDNSGDIVYEHISWSF